MTSITVNLDNVDTDDHNNNPANKVIPSSSSSFAPAKTTRRKLALVPELDPKQGGMSVEEALAKFKRKEDTIEWAVDTWRQHTEQNLDLPDEYCQLILDYEFSAKLRVPRLRNLVKTAAKTPKVRSNYRLSAPQLFVRGSWVEYLGLDTVWHLAPVQRVLYVGKEEDEDAEEAAAHNQLPMMMDEGKSGGGGETRAENDKGGGFDPESTSSLDNPPMEVDFFYSIGRHTVRPSHVRLSESCVRQLYGPRPLLWMQYAVLQVESIVRFQKNHEDDFQRMSFVRTARELWVSYLRDERNVDFFRLVAACEKRYPGSYAKLLGFVLSPFVVMDAQSKSDEWDFTDASIYVYLALFGTGFLLCVAVTVVQFVIPLLLLVTAMSEAGGNLPNLPTDGDVVRFNDGFFMTDWSTFCSSDGPVEGRVMQLVVIVVYVVRVLPDLLYNFYLTMGDGDTPLSKLLSLRKEVWNQADDTVGQQIGFRWLIYMKTLYIAVSLTILLFVLFLTPSVFDIVLNALALEFVYTLDDQVGSMAAFDPGYRYLRAGAVETAMRATIRLEYLEDYKKLCREFDIDEKLYKQAMSELPGGAVGSCLMNRTEAVEDVRDPVYLNQEKRFLNKMTTKAVQSGNKRAIKYFTEPLLTYGVVETYLVRRGIFFRDAIFSRYSEYCVWRRWEKVLFLPRCPTLEDLEALHKRFFVAGGGTKEDEETRPSRAESSLILNYSERVYYTALAKFLAECGDVLAFRAMKKSVGVALAKKMYVSAAFRAVDGVAEWFSYVYQFGFPFLLVCFFLLSAVCY